jgi:hypothetical protein
MPQDAPSLDPQGLAETFEVLERSGEGDLRWIADRGSTAAARVVVDDLALVGKGIQRAKVPVAQLGTTAHHERATAADAHDMHVDIANRHGLSRGLHLGTSKPISFGMAIEAKHGDRNRRNAGMEATPRSRAYHRSVRLLTGRRLTEVDVG